MTMQRAECGVRSAESDNRAAPHTSRPGLSAGFTFIALLAAITIMGITLGVAGKHWRNVMLREREEELLFRGDEYRRAIEKYYFSIPGRRELPPSIDELLKDSRSVSGKRHLRKKYPDPITGEEFVVIKDAALGNRVSGVRSSSEKETLKKANFPPAYKDFENKEKYSEWEFKYQPQQTITIQQNQPKQTNAP